MWLTVELCKFIPFGSDSKLFKTRTPGKLLQFHSKCSRYVPPFVTATFYIMYDFISGQKALRSLIVNKSFELDGIFPIALNIIIFGITTQD